MSTHRQHYLDLHEQMPANPQPMLQTEFDAGGGVGGYIVGGVIVLCLSIAGIASLVKSTLDYPTTPPAVVLPRPQALDEARIEGFRAGYEAATQQACQQAALSSPLADR